MKISATAQKINENRERIVRRSASSSKLLKIADNFTIGNMKAVVYPELATKFQHPSSKNLLLSLKNNNNSKAPSPVALKRKQYKISPGRAELSSNYFKDPCFTKISQFPNAMKTASGEAFSRKNGMAPSAKRQESQKELGGRSHAQSRMNTSRATLRVSQPLEYSPIRTNRSKKINSFIYDIQSYYQERRTRCSHHEAKNMSSFDNFSAKLQTVQPCLILATMDHNYIMSTKQRDIPLFTQTVTFSRSASINTRRSSPKSSSKKLPVMA